MTTGLPSDIEWLEMGLQTMVTDKMLNQVKVDSERDVRYRAWMLRTTWEAASRTMSVERMEQVPASGWDYLKKYIPFLKPSMIYREIHIKHMCPHRMVLEQDPHLNWLKGRAN